MIGAQRDFPLFRDREFLLFCCILRLVAIDNYMEIKLANHLNYTFEEVMSAKSNGGTFVTYQWIIPTPIFFPVRRLSKVYFIPRDMDKSTYAQKFNILSLLIGWWGLPWGPVAVYKSIVLNNTGGVDVTDDVYLNIDRTGYSNGRFQLTKSATKFIHPPKSEAKEHLKVFTSLIDSSEINFLPIVGVYIDCEEGVEPYTIIGFDEDISLKKELIAKAIGKRFSKHFVYELIQLNKGFSLSEQLSSQGLQL